MWISLIKKWSKITIYLLFKILNTSGTYKKFTHIKFSQYNFIIKHTNIPLKLFKIRAKNTTSDRHNNYCSFFIINKKCIFFQTNESSKCLLDDESPGDNKSICWEDRKAAVLAEFITSTPLTLVSSFLHSSDNGNDF